MSTTKQHDRRRQLEDAHGKGELLQGELFTSLTEACWLAERWRHAYNEERHCYGYL